MKSVRELAKKVYRLSQIEVPELSRSEQNIVEESDGTRYYDIEADNDWWEAWCEICDIIGDSKITFEKIRPDIDQHRQFMTIKSETRHTSLSVSVYADGDMSILAEYYRGDGSWDILFEGRHSNKNIDPIELGRRVAETELTRLACKTGSTAETLDYWQTNISPREFSQRNWASIRDVNRQTVNDRVSSASDKTVREYGPGELQLALNNVKPGDDLDFSFVSGDRITGGGTYRVDEQVLLFGDGGGHIRCKHPESDTVTDIKEMDNGRVALEQNGELAHVAAHVSIN